MEENQIQSSDAQDEQDGGKKGQRSNSFTVKTLPEIISFGENIYKELGSHTYFDKDAIARANGVTYFAIKQTLSTAQQYGILLNKWGGGYKLTDLFISIVHPKNDQEYNESIITSLNTPEIFKKLNEAFNNKRLPNLSGITNTIIRDSGLKQDNATRVANIYVENLKHFGLLDNNGFVALSISPNRNTQTQTGNGADTPPPPPPPFVEDTKPPLNKDLQDILIPLKERREAHLIIPIDYKDEDINRILKFVEALRNE